MGSVSFDRIADSYDETRGGLERGGNLAREIAPLLRDGAVVEIGVGTGAVALPLRRLGHPVAGLDLSLPMLRRSRDRLGPCVARGDGYRLPLRTAATPNVVIVWVLQLVPDLAGFLAEARRVLARGGRLTVLPAGGQYEDDDIDAILRPMHHALRPPRDQPPQIVAAAESVGLALADRVAVRGDVWRHSPEEQAASIEARAWSSLWDVPDDRWAAVVEPALAALRAMPEPHRQRQRRTHHDILAFEHA